MNTQKGQVEKGKMEDKALLKELERETKKANKSTFKVTNNPIKVTDFRDGTPNKRMKLYIMFLKSSVLLQVLLALMAIIISLGLMVAGVKVVLEHSDKTGVAILITVLLSYCILVNVKRFVK